MAERLLAKNHLVRVVVRSSHRLPVEVLENPSTTVIAASVLDLTDQEMAEHLKDCDAVVSCLGHVTDLKPDLDEKRTRFDRGLLTVMRHTLPPHRDNETASEHLRRNVGRESTHIEWCSVRPDSLIDAGRDER